MPFYPIPAEEHWEDISTEMDSSIDENTDKADDTTGRALPDSSPSPIMRTNSHGFNLNNWSTSASTSLPAPVPLHCQHSHAWPNPLEPNAFMDHQSRYLQNMIYQMSSDIYESNLKIAQQNESINSMKAIVDYMTNKMSYLEEQIKDLTQDLSYQKQVNAQGAADLAHVRAQLGYVQECAPVPELATGMLASTQQYPYFYQTHDQAQGYPLRHTIGYYSPRPRKGPNYGNSQM